MQIELKNIYTNERFSEETTMFRADVFINGKKVGYAENGGRGGSTNVQPYKAEDWQIINKAEAWCKTLPPEPFSYEDANGKTVHSQIDSNLENYIDDLLTKHLQEKDRKKFELRKEKDMLSAIVVGVPGAGEYATFGFKLPLETILATPVYRAKFKTVLTEKVLPKLKVGEKILNTNIPPADLVQMGVPKDRIIELAIPLKKKTGGPRPKVAPQAKKKRGPR